LPEHPIKQFVKEKVYPIIKGTLFESALTKSPIANLKYRHLSYEVIEILDVFTREAIHTLELIDGHYNKSMKLFEIGGGIGLVNAWLQVSGYEIISIEPSDGGHDNYYEIGAYIIKNLNLDKNRWKPLKAEQINPLGEKYDLVFSNNVLEHINDVDAAFKKMGSCLNNSGVMRHCCPNYAIPYEPHYGIPLLPFMEKYTTFLMPNIRNEELWRSINFISAKEVRRICKKHSYVIDFDRETTYKSISRLFYDEKFAERHVWLKYIFGIMKKLRILSWLKLIPAVYATPILFTVRLQ